MNSEYLGDGLYAYFDGYQIRLYTLEHHEVFLEPRVMKQLIAFAKNIGMIKDT